MDFMKVFDQTVREIKREVNLKVLKVPEMEQKVNLFDSYPYVQIVSMITRQNDRKLSIDLAIARK
jgi:hypothetical protein